MGGREICKAKRKGKGQRYLYPSHLYCSCSGRGLRGTESELQDGSTEFGVLDRKFGSSVSVPVRIQLEHSFRPDRRGPLTNGVSSVQEHWDQKEEREAATVFLPALSRESAAKELHAAPSLPPPPPVDPKAMQFHLCLVDGATFGTSGLIGIGKITGGEVLSGQIPSSDHTPLPSVSVHSPLPNSSGASKFYNCRR